MASAEAWTVRDCGFPQPVGDREMCDAIRSTIASIPRRVHGDRRGLRPRHPRVAAVADLCVLPGSRRSDQPLSPSDVGDGEPGGADHAPLARRHTHHLWRITAGIYDRRWKARDRLQRPRARRAALHTRSRRLDSVSGRIRWARPTASCCRSRPRISKRPKRVSPGARGDVERLTVSATITRRIRSTG